MNDLNFKSGDEEKEPQIIQVFDGVTISEPIPTLNSGDGQRKDKTPSRFSRFKRLNAKPQSQKTPGGSMTITWFKSLHLGHITNIDFPESLLMITESGSTVGKYYCSVKRSLLVEDQCVLVHFGSCSTMPDGLECGISVTGFVDDNLQTIQESTHEWMKLNGKSVERKFLLMRELDKNQYFCKNTVWENGSMREENNFTVELSDMELVISESANVILQRIIIQQKKTGQIELRALTTKGAVVRSIFRELGEGVENIRGDEMNVRGVRRTVIDGKNVEEWDSIYNEHGRMVLRCQPDKDHALIPLWFKSVEKYTTSGEFIGTRPPLVWACDMEMYAQYIERKDLLISQHKNYLVRHPIVKALLSDFLQAVLQKKPKKVVEFGMQFFETFLHNQPDLDLCMSDTDSDATVDDFEVIYPEPKWEDSVMQMQKEQEEVVKEEQTETERGLVTEADPNASNTGNEIDLTAATFSESGNPSSAHSGVSNTISEGSYYGQPMPQIDPNDPNKAYGQFEPEYDPSIEQETWDTNATFQTDENNYYY